MSRSHNLGDCSILIRQIKNTLADIDMLKLFINNFLKVLIQLFVISLFGIKLDVMKFNIHLMMDGYSFGMNVDDNSCSCNAIQSDKSRKDCNCLEDGSAEDSQHCVKGMNSKNLLKHKYYLRKLYQITFDYPDVVKDFNRLGQSDKFLCLGYLSQTLGGTTRG